MAKSATKLTSINHTQRRNMEIQQKHAYRALSLSTLAFAACFSVWTLYSILGIELKSSLNLTSTEFGLLLAAPIFTGAIFRIPVGFLSERVSCRNLFFWQIYSFKISFYIIHTNFVEFVNAIKTILSAARVFKGKFICKMVTAGYYQPTKKPKEWNADCTCVGKGGSALIYLARYLYRGVVNENNILSLKNDHVTFRYKNSTNQQSDKPNHHEHPW